MDSDTKNPVKDTEEEKKKRRDIWVSWSWNIFLFAVILDFILGSLGILPREWSFPIFICLFSSCVLSSVVIDYCCGFRTWISVVVYVMYKPT